MTDIRNFNHICRLCTANLNNEAQSIFDDQNFENSILKKIKDCLHVKIENDDRLPKSICKGCVTKVNDYNSYRESCLQTELMLLNCLRLSNSNELSSQYSFPVKIKSENIKTENIKTENDDVDKKNNNNLSDSDMSPGETADNNITDEDEDEYMEEEKVDTSVINFSITPTTTTTRDKLLPKLGEPSPDDYVLMKEESFSLDPVKDAGRGATSSILADYLIEFSNSKVTENDLKDKDVVECQRLRREVLPPMWDVYEKTVPEKLDINNEGNFEKDKKVTVTHRRYIINKGAFSCSLCGECFEFDQGKKRDDLSEEKAKLYDCQTCGKIFPRRSSWKRHQNTHEDVKPYTCRVCNKGFNRREHLSRHLMSHGSVKPYLCGCGKPFAKKDNLMRHQLCNPSCAVQPDNIIRPFTCDVCSQGFVRKEHLQRHRKRTHDLDPPESDPEPKPFTCYICSKTFTRREHLKRHQLIHQRDLTVNCLNSSSSKSSLTASSEFPKFPKTELTLFQTNPILPEITLSEIVTNNNHHSSSSNNFQIKSEIPKILNHHFDNEVMIKEERSNNFNNNELDYQIMMQQDDEPEPTDELVIDEDAEEPLPPIPVLEMNTDDDAPTPIDITKSNTFCNVCFKNFSRRSHLLRHMKRIHRMQLPSCPRRKPAVAAAATSVVIPPPVIISKTLPPPPAGDENDNSLTESEFAAVANTIATTYSSQQQKFSCQQCGKTFTRKSHLERHEKIHQISSVKKDGGVLPYECVTCGESFLQSKLLDKHMEIHGNTVSNNFVWM